MEFGRNENNYAVVTGRKNRNNNKTKNPTQNPLAEDG